MSIEKQNKKDELDKLLTEMRADNSMPASKFDQKLKSKLLGKTGKQNLLGRGFLGLGMRPALFVASVMLLLTAIIGVGGGYLYFNTAKKQEDGVLLNEVQKVEFLSNVIENNPQGLLNTDLIATAETASQFNIVSDIQTERYVAEAADKTYTFSHSTSKFAIGPAQSRCNIYGDRESSTNEYYEYIDGEGFHAKSIDKDENGELTNYYLFTANKYIYFLGGKYAVQNNLPDEPAKETPIEEDATDKEGSEDLADKYFGGAAKVEKMGDNTYRLTYESEISCDKSNILPIEQDAAAPSTKLIYRYYIDGSSYEVFRSEEYLESVSEENLLSTFETQTEKSNKTFAEVSDTFKFEYDVEIRDENEYTKTYGELREGTMNYLKENSIRLLTFQDKNITLSGVDVPAFYSTYYVPAYLLDRDFYLEGEKGDELYNNSAEIYGRPEEDIVPKLLVSHTDQEEVYYFDYYDKTYSNEEILEDNTANALSLIGTEFNVKIDGKNTAAIGYTETAACDANTDCPANYYYHFVLFDFDEYKILLSIYTTKPLSDFTEKLAFTTLDIKKKEDFETVNNVLKAKIREVEDSVIILGD